MIEVQPYGLLIIDGLNKVTWESFCQLKRILGMNLALVSCEVLVVVALARGLARISFAAHPHKSFHMSHRRPIHTCSHTFGNRSGNVKGRI